MSASRCRIAWKLPIVLSELAALCRVARSEIEDGRGRADGLGGREHARDGGERLDERRR